MTLRTKIKDLAMKILGIEWYEYKFIIDRRENKIKVYYEEEICILSLGSRNMDKCKIGGYLMEKNTMELAEIIDLVDCGRIKIKRIIPIYRNAFGYNVRPSFGKFDIIEKEDYSKYITKK